MDLYLQDSCALKSEHGTTYHVGTALCSDELALLTCRR